MKMIFMGLISILITILQPIQKLPGFIQSLFIREYEILVVLQRERFHNYLTQKKSFF